MIALLKEMNHQMHKIQQTTKYIKALPFTYSAKHDVHKRTLRMLAAKTERDYWYFCILLFDKFY